MEQNTTFENKHKFKEKKKKKRIYHSPGSWHEHQQVNCLVFPNLSHYETQVHVWITVATMQTHRNTNMRWNWKELYLKIFVSNSHYKTNIQVPDICIYHLHYKKKDLCNLLSEAMLQRKWWVEISLPSQVKTQYLQI